ncbi:MAG TPA: DUF2252 family protein [Gaiellaceae bacterium]
MKNADKHATHVLDENAPTVETSSRPKPVSHLTPAERAAKGKAARAELPRSSHAGWEPSPGRRDPIDLLEEQAQMRLPELGPIRYGRMLVSPFTFFRGGAYLMAADLADEPRTGLHVQLCGDAHLSNFGISRHRTGGLSSASTISTRRCRDPSSGTSSGLPRVSLWPAGIEASTMRLVARS